MLIAFSQAFGESFVQRADNRNLFLEMPGFGDAFEIVSVVKRLILSKL